MGSDGKIINFIIFHPLKRALNPCYPSIRGTTGRMAIQGYIDRVCDGRIEGWARDSERPDCRLIVEARAEGRSLGLARADLFRADVAAGGFGDGHSGFILDLAGFADGEASLEVSVVLANTDQPVPGSPVSVPRADGRRARLRGDVHVAGQTVRGWVMDARQPAQALTVLLREDDRVIARATADQFRGDLAGQGIGDRAFEIRLPLALADGSPHLIHVETEEGAAVPGSPLTYAWRPDGPRAVLRDVARWDGQPEDGRAVCLLDRYLAQLERAGPGSVAFDDYPVWFDHFMARTGPDPAAGRKGGLRLVIDIGAELAAGYEWLHRLEVPPGAAVQLTLGVDTEAWNNADEQLRQVLRRHAGAEVVDRAALTPWRALSAAGRDDFVLWLEPGARLHPAALVPLAAALGEEVDLAYADWESVEEGRRVPHLLPDWNHHYFLSTDYLGPLVAFRAGGLRPQPDDDWSDIRCRAVEAARPGAIRHVSRVLGAAARGIGRGLPRTALLGHAERLGLGCRIRRHPILEDCWAFDFAPAEPVPLVSLIIPTRDKLELIRPCVESLLSRTAYPALEVIIVDNGSRDPQTLRFLAEAEASGRVRVHRDDRPFNYSALNNGAAAAARGTVIGLLNNDILVPPDCDPGWLHRVVGRLMAPRVGAVGIKLIYASGLVQHAGVVVGVGGMAENAFKHLRADEPGYDGRAVLAQEVSAVTAAALFLRRDSYEAVGGLDEDGLPVAFNDVDLCLKIGAAGESVVLDPEIVFFHLESASRGTAVSAEVAARDARERATFQSRWADAIAADRHYSLNLNLDGLPYRGLALPPRPGPRRPIAL